MPNRIIRTAMLLAGCSLLAVSSAAAQEKAAPKMLERTTSSAAARTALSGALAEITNIGGGRRIDPRLKEVIAADPGFALGRAFYGGWATLTAAERNAELTQALKDAAAGTTAELTFIAALREWRAGRAAVARDLVDVVLKLTPDDPDVHWFRLLIAANADEALRIGEAAVSRFPDYGPIYNIYAYRLNTAGRTDEAYQMLQKYVSLVPDHPNPHDSYAEILQLNGRYDEAETHYRQALEIDPQADVAHEGLAEVAVLRGNYAGARPHLMQSLGMATAPARRLVLQREIASTYLYEGKIKDAKAALTSVIKEAESNSLPAFADKRALAFLTFFEGNKAEAARQFAASQPPTPAPTLPLSEVILHALLEHPAEVATAVAAMEANAANAPDVMDTQQAMHAARAIGALMKNDLSAARAAHAQVTTPSYKALSAAFLVRAANKAGDKAAATTAMADVEAFQTLNLNAGFARLIAKRK
ncbi:MAG TPA: tetratricopeptide repeat protein [Longimicrobiales bacterium]